MMRIVEYFSTLRTTVFRYGSPDQIGLTRMAIGFCVLANIIFRMSNLEFFYTDNGPFPVQVMDDYWGPIGINLMRGLHDIHWITAYFYSLVLAAFFMMIGLFSRLSTLWVCLGIMSLDTRNPFIGSGDPYLRVTLVYLALAEVGQAFSIDNFLRRNYRKLFWKSPPKDLIPQWPRYTLLFQIAVVYGTGIIHKLLDVTWRDGTAMIFVLRSEARSAFPIPRFLGTPLISLLETYAVLFVELMLVASVFVPRMRKLWVPLGIILHVSIAYVYDLIQFSMFILSTYLCFLSDDQTQKIARTWSRIKKK